MAIQPGTRLGPYEVQAAIGAGGMGEVYKARDTRLDRTVAIKVLPTHLADQPEVRERFEREARTIASLNHPHICTLYDTGRQDGTDFLVMEYLEGETLAARLLKGPLPLDQVLRYAIEISDALDRAHHKGITHRDLKPGNVMLTKDGTKLLDFGLAKLKESALTESVSQMPTVSHSPTAQGTLLGTMQYMAPEQVEGKNDEIDGRTDIFAFGAVVYEMATGKKAFEGKTNARVIGAILKDEPPPISSLQPMTPPPLDHIVKKCLAKEPERRWQAASDVCDELKWIAESGVRGERASGAQAEAAAGGADANRRRALLWGGGALVLVGLAALGIWRLQRPPERVSEPVSRIATILPPGQVLSGLDVGVAIALSPDGTRVAYVARQGGVQRLYLRPLAGLDARAVAGSEGAVEPFFSPDGRWVGFFAGGKMKKVSADTGEAINVADAVDPRGASWNSRGTIVFAPTRASVLQSVPEAGGSPQAVTRLEEGMTAHRWPEFLPGGEAMLFAAWGSGRNWNEAHIVAQSLMTGERKDLIQGGTHPRYATSGHLIYEREGNLMAVPFDAQRLEVTGAPVQVVDGVAQAPLTGAAQYSISATGSLVYVPSGVAATQRRLVWVSRNGAEQPLAAAPRGYRLPRISPNGQRLAVAIEDSDEIQVWLYDLARGALTRLTFEGSSNFGTSWTPDGTRIATGIASDCTWQLADGGGRPERMSEHACNGGGSFSSDGRLMAFSDGPVRSQNISVLRLSDGEVEPFAETPFDETAPALSPDGRWLAYSSNESGRYEVYVQPYPGPGGKYQISTDGGGEAVWNPMGREIFYRSGDRVMAADITAQPSFSAGRPRMLFQGQYQSSPTGGANYDVSRDGQRFLMVKPAAADDSAPTQINVVLNWFEELKQRVPAGTK